jgi:hypothetical protein
VRARSLERAASRDTRDHVRMQKLRRFFKANPQALVLLMICLVLGLGTFLAVVFGVVTSKNPTTPSGEPSGSLTPRVTLVTNARGGGRVGAAIK